MITNIEVIHRKKKAENWGGKGKKNMANLTSNISIITLNIKGLNELLKRQI